jgi:hypothetical protein
MTPILANIVGPPRVATIIRASIAACHSGLRKLGDVVASVLECDELAAVGQVDRIVEFA